VADLNGDGKLDLAAGNVRNLICCCPPCPISGQGSVLLGGGDGTLGEETLYVFGTSYSLGVADFDKDGHLDLISDGSTILFGDGDGTFGQAQGFAHLGPGVVDDFNRDGRPDVATADTRILVALNQGSSNHSPVAIAGVDTALECASASGAEALLDGSASSDPDSTPGTSDDIAAFDWFEDYGLATQQQLGSGETLHLVLPLGVHSITLRVTDRTGAAATSETSIRVADTVPPRISVHLTPDLLWPPNHQMVDISAEVIVADACGQPAAILSSIQSGGQASASRRSAFAGSDVNGADIGTSDFNFQLQAGRSTSKRGWSYLVTYSATDSAGNQSSATGVVRVVHDRRRSPAADPSP
jgi:VCBS repeat protein